MVKLAPQTTALILIDLQNGILARQGAPRPTGEVLEKSKTLAARFRAAGAPVVLVRVAFAADYADVPPGLVDEDFPRPEGGLPPGWADLADGLASPGDILVTKRQWGAFTGTELDLQMRRRGIQTVVIGGIATNFGVESTARHAWELGYNTVIVEDICTSFSTELHNMPVQAVFPRIARVVQSDAIDLH